MNYKTVIGLEVHVELSTKTKIFCGCSTDFGGAPNAHVCPVCLGMPGSLPVLNKEVVEKAIRAGLALNCTINEDNIFDRKNYFYPDLPKDYQISQLYHPICTNGFVEIDMGSYKKKVRIHEIHMEEDAGKLVHEVGASLVDYNRCGVPLIEIVSEPDLSSAEEVAVYLDTLREILTYLDVSDCKMEEGSMRADVNLSVKKEDSDELGTRTETKNMNSIKAIGRSIEFETERQINIIESGGNVTQETRRWDDNLSEGYAMRSKENAQDYRYFPDPDLVPLKINEAWISEIKEAFPELAAAKRARYTEDFGIPKKIAAVLTDDQRYAELFEAITEKLGGGAEAAREAANTVTGDILRLTKETGEYKEVSADKIATVIRLVKDGKINRNSGKDIVEAIFRADADPDRYVIEHNLEMVSDEGLIAEVVGKILADNLQSVKDYMEGKEKAFGFLVGQSMKELKGKASPQAVNAILKKQLEAAGATVNLSAKATGASDSENPDSSAEGTGESGKASSNAADIGGGDEKSYKPPEIPAWKRAILNAGQPESSAPEQSGNAAPKQAADSADSKGQLRWSNRYRTYTCGDLTPNNIGEEIKLAGWINTIRNHGGIVFVDLRDQYGVTQVVVSDEQVKTLGKEMTVSIIGKVLKRDEDTINPHIGTGLVELKAESIEILGPSKTNLPFEIDASIETREEVRLKYRYLDLRNPQVHDKIILRSAIIKHLRNEMDGLGFTEIQTPILANSSPEGARDYLVPSRKHKGRFYALPQAPQQFKQLLMVSGFDRYFQIAPCFRDEDARLDRSPGEFYQLDYEMAFATQEDVFAVAEKVLTSTFKRFTDKKVSEPPYTRLTYEEAMLNYGSDKPDLRNPLLIMDLTDFFKGVDFKPFQGSIVRGIVVPNAINQSKSWFGSMEKFALSIGMKGLGYISVKEDMTYKGPIDKFFTEDQKKEIAEIASLKSGDVLYFISDTAAKVSEYAGQIRTEVAKRLDLIAKDRFDFCYVTDYPMYELNEETGQIDFTHNPFSMPQGEMEALLNEDPLSIKAWQYDIVCNGVELSSGAVRNHRPDVMVKAFEIAGYTEKDVEEKFGALYSAFQYGAPPHAGMAPGVDRIVMLLSEEENIREIIAFPLNSNAQNLMLDAPSEVSEQQLRDVHIKVR